MNDFYYRVHWEEVVGKTLVDSGMMTCKYTRPATPDDFREYIIHQSAKRADAVIVIPLYDEISKEEFEANRLGQNGG